MPTNAEPRDWSAEKYLAAVTTAAVAATHPRVPASRCPGLVCDRARRPARPLLSEPGCTDEALGRRLHQADQDADCAHHLLHHGARHRQHGRHEEGRPGRPQGADLFRGDDHAGVHHRPLDRQSLAAGGGDERRSRQARHQHDRDLHKHGGRAEHDRLPHAHHPGHGGWRLRRGEILQVLFFAILFAFALHWLGERGKPLLSIIDQTAHVFSGIVGMVKKVAPLGAFGAMAFTIGEYGLGTLLSLGSLMLGFYATCLLFIFGALGALCWLCGFSIFRFIKYIKEELLIVLGTSSSDSVLPR